MSDGSEGEPGAVRVDESMGRVWSIVRGLVTLVLGDKGGETVSAVLKV